MYLNYFDLNKSPFGITPDTSLFFDGAERGDVLQALLYAINAGEGIIKVVGEVGSGKTMLSRMLTKKVPSNVDLVFLLNPRIKPEQVLYAIAYDLGLEVDINDSSIHVLHLLQKRLLSLFNEGKKVVLIIDEAQQMPLETLEEIRLLSNLETETEKLIQIVLLGQPELDHHIDTPKIRQLRERIAYSFYLSPLSWELAKDYLEFRLAKAGNQGRAIFSSRAIKLMSKYSEGTLRRLNMLADKSLLAAFLDKSPVVEPLHVRIALKDNAKGYRQNFFGVAAAIIILFFLIVLGGVYFGPLVTAKAKSPTAIVLPVTKKVSVKNIIREVSSVNQVTDTQAVESEVALVEGPILVEENSFQPESVSLLKHRLHAFNLWQEQYSQSYTIRLLSAVGSGGGSVERFLQSVDDINEIYITKLDTGNSDYVVYYGNYSGYSEALNALSALPGSMKKFSPYVSRLPK